MKIFVTTLGANPISLEVKHSDTIRDLKDMIQEKIGIPPNQQALIFNQMVLDDSCTLVDFNINEGSMFTLMHKSRGLMQIFVQTQSEKTFSLEVKPSHTITKVKTMIHDKEGIPPDQQVLILDKMALEDNSTLADFRIKKESILTLVQKWNGFMPIFVKTLTGKIFILDVRPSDTVHYLKAKIQKDDGTPPHKQCLLFKGRNLEDGRTFAEHNIHKESVLDLVIRIP